jgi:ribosomal protein L44E
MCAGHITHRRNEEGFGTFIGMCAGHITHRRNEEGFGTFVAVCAGHITHRRNEEGFGTFIAMCAGHITYRRKEEGFGTFCKTVEERKALFWTRSIKSYAVCVLCDKYRYLFAVPHTPCVGCRLSGLSAERAVGRAGYIRLTG